MKLFLVTYLAGKMAAVVGPVPVDIDECLARAARFQDQIRAQVVKKPELGYQASDVVLECQLHPERPKLENPVQVYP